jgi:hypothetical protein
VITFPGSLDDRDAQRAVTFMGGEAVPLWHADHDLRGVDAVVLPGGFSYGDYLRCGAIARFCSKRLKMRVTVVELNGAVVDTCRVWFRLPPTSATFDVLTMDAGRFVADPAQRATADVLAVNLYDHEAASPVLDSA